MIEELKIIPDERIITSLGANAVAQTSIAATYGQTKKAMESIAAAASAPQTDEDAWWDIFLVRARMPDQTHSNPQAAADYANKALALRRARFPRVAIPAPVPPVVTAPTPAAPVVTVPTTPGTPVPPVIFQPPAPLPPIAPIPVPPKGPGVA